MGLLGNLFGNNVSEKIQAVRGYFVIEIESMCGGAKTDEEFEQIMIDASKAIDPFLPSIKDEIVDFANTFSKCCKNNVEEFVGLAITLCWIRFAYLYREAKEGRIASDGVNLNNLFQVIHKQALQVLNFK